MSDALDTESPVSRELPAERQLLLTMDRTSQPPSPEHALLVSFYFGEEAGAGDDPAIVDTGLHPLADGPRYENWWYRGAVAHRIVGDCRIAECDDYAIVTLQLPDAPAAEFRELSYEAYRALLEAVASTGKQQLIRIWNYFPHINEGSGDAEKYRQFSIGRAEAFAEVDFGVSGIPAGTATGCVEGGPFSIVALVSSNEFRAVENPRQVSAYEYPRQYGPKSPQFSRGATVAADDHLLYLISGTAAVVGHESAHPYDTERQIGETVENLKHIGNKLSDGVAGLPHFALDDECVLRVYVRSPEDYALVLDRLGSALGHPVTEGDNVVFLRSDICRRELMVEVDGTRCF
ncbi:MAG: hypothetical protein AAFX10_05525 [Pseudomonadota bacterium]